MLWTPDRILEIVDKRGYFSVTPRYRDDQATRVADRLWKAGELNRERQAYRTYMYTKPEKSVADTTLEPNEARRAMLVRCRDQFALYAKNHRAKAERVSDFAARQDAIHKAETNEHFVRRIDQVLEL